MNARTELVEQNYFTTGQASKFLGLSPSGVVYLCNRNEISYHWAGGRRKISESAIRDYLEMNSHKAVFRPPVKTGRRPWRNK